MEKEKKTQPVQKPVVDRTKEVVKYNVAKLPARLRDAVVVYGD